MGLQICLTGFLFFLIALFCDIGSDRFQHWVKLAGGIGFWAIPVGILVWIWQ